MEETTLILQWVVQIGQIQRENTISNKKIHTKRTERKGVACSS